jgi:hypothetical protein
MVGASYRAIHGPIRSHQFVRYFPAQLAGQWFNGEFADAMGALLVAAETGKSPINSARGAPARE